MLYFSCILIWTKLYLHLEIKTLNLRLRISWNKRQRRESLIRRLVRLKEQNTTWKSCQMPPCTAPYYYCSMSVHHLGVCIYILYFAFISKCSSNRCCNALPHPSWPPNSFDDIKTWKTIVISASTPPALPIPSSLANLFFMAYRHSS